jgi:hypothetical protein
MTCEKDVSTMRFVVGAMAGPVRVCISEDTGVAVAVAVAVQLKVSCGFEILEHSLCWGHMAGEWTRIVSAESSNCI